MGESRIMRVLCEWASMLGWAYSVTGGDGGRSLYFSFRHCGDRFRVRVSDHGSEWWKPDGVKRFSIRVGRATTALALLVVLARFERLALAADCGEKTSPERGVESGCTAMECIAGGAISSGAGCGYHGLGVIRVDVSLCDVRAK